MAQPRLSPDLPLTTLKQVTLTTGPFLFAWSLIRGYASRNGPIPAFSTIITINSILYAAFSGLLSYLLIQSYIISDHTAPDPTVLIPLPSGLTIPFFDRSSLTLAEIGYIYHLSKIYEYIDVLLLVGQGKVVGQHMAFHHITTPYLTHFRVLECGGTDWRVFALANTLHHTIMYAYFGGLGPWLRHLLSVTGSLQLMLGIGVDALWLYRTEGGKRLEGMITTKDEARNRGLTILVLVRYAMLFAEELKMGRAGMKKEARDEVQAMHGRGQVEPVETKKGK